MMYGASPINEALLKRAMAGLPGTEFHQLYGMTELAPLATHPAWGTIAPSHRFALAGDCAADDGPA